MQRKYIVEKIYSKEALRLADSTTILFLGDSRAMCAFNDSIIPNSFNASRNSESLFQTYNKLKILLDANPQLEDIVLSVSQHNIAAPSEALILYGDRYFPLFDDESVRFIQNAANNGLIDCKKDSQGIFLQLKHYATCFYLKYKWKCGLPFNIGNYLDYLTSKENNSERIYSNPIFSKPHQSTNTNLDPEVIDRAILRHFNQSCTHSHLLEYYISRITDLCIKFKVRLFIVNTPQHMIYRRKIPACINSHFSSLLLTLIERNKNTYFLDYSQLVLPDEMYGDGDHLNRKGSVRFSEILSVGIR